VEEKLRALLQLWKTKAENDLKVVNRELETIDPVTDITCYHCQQASEKYLKLYLISQGIAPVKTHLLSNLIQECIRIDSDFLNLQDVLFLSEYAVEIRYPDDFYMPTVEECQNALAAALKVRKLVIGKTPCLDE
jgi:HEPN domain-containing protein